MFYIEDQDKKRHKFHSERYARGYLKAMYNEKIWEIENHPERYELQGKTWSENEFRISVKDNGRLYFLDRTKDVKNVLYTGRLGRQIKAGLI